MLFHTSQVSASIQQHPNKQTAAGQNETLTSLVKRTYKDLLKLVVCDVVCALSCLVFVVSCCVSFFGFFFLVVCRFLSSYFWSKTTICLCVCLSICLFVWLFVWGRFCSVRSRSKSYLDGFGARQLFDSLIVCLFGWFWGQRFV